MIGDEEQIAALLRELAPAPEGWVAAARELPRARRALEAIQFLVLDDARARALETGELERALAAAGFEPTAELLQAVRHEIRRPTS
jgi:hypothetical protein